MGILSWKQYWNESDRQVARELYAALVGELEASARNLSAAGIENTLHPALGPVQQALAGNPTADQLSKTHSEVTAALRLYIDGVRGFITLREEDVRQIVAVLARGIATIAAAGHQHHTNLTGFATILQHVGESANLREIRRRLSEEVSNIRAYLDRMAGENRSTIEHLEEQLALVQDRLADVEKLARTDALTGLLNRREGEQCLRQAIDAGSPFCVLLLDLNDFKHINDRWGHVCGDQILTIIGRKLQKWADHATAVSRWGGDEFLVVSPGSLDAGSRVRDTLRQAISGCYTIVVLGNTYKVAVGTAIGLAEYQSGENQEELLCRADVDLYADKQQLTSASLRRAGLAIPGARTVAETAQIVPL
jgi:diguanylate cyclase (GGDEF)-like protein